LVFGCENLGKTYRSSGFHLEGVDLQLRLGEITGVVGENGNGKTTQINLVTVFFRELPPKPALKPGDRPPE